MPTMRAGPLRRPGELRQSRHPALQRRLRREDHAQTAIHSQCELGASSIAPRCCEALLFQSHIHHAIGLDTGLGLQYRPLLNDNIVVTGGFGALAPGRRLQRYLHRPDAVLRLRQREDGVLMRALLLLLSIASLAPPATFCGRRRRSAREERRLPIRQVPRRDRADARLAGRPPRLHRLPRRHAPTPPTSSPPTCAPRNRRALALDRQSRRAATPRSTRRAPEFVRFVNPGDLRVADQTCGTAACHGAIVAKVRTSLMSPRRVPLGRGAVQQRRASR